MKASKLLHLLEKAINKYGDIEVKAYSQDYAHDITEEGEAHDFKLRVLDEQGELPGESLEEEERKAFAPFAVLFYD
jgi:hypothetical protein